MQLIYFQEDYALNNIFQEDNTVNTIFSTGQFS